MSRGFFYRINRMGKMNRIFSFMNPVGWAALMVRGLRWVFPLRSDVFLNSGFVRFLRRIGMPVSQPL